MADLGVGRMDWTHLRAAAGGPDAFGLPVLGRRIGGNAMWKRTWLAVATLSVVAAGCSDPESTTQVVEPAVTLGDTDNGERHLANLRQLTFSGENAEAYYAFDGSRLIFQTRREGVPCDQIYTMELDGTGARMVSSGNGRTTCGYFFPDGESIVYASTHLGGAECPPEPGFEMGYVWPIYDSYDMKHFANICLE